MHATLIDLVREFKSKHVYKYIYYLPSQLVEYDLLSAREV